MSYILDALKRADAERERGHVPGLHSQSTTTPTSAQADPRRQRPGAALVGSVATLLLLVAAVWWWLATPEPEMPQPATTLAPAAPPLPAAVPEPVPAAPPAVQAGPALPILSPEPVPAAASSSARLPVPTQASTNAGSPAIANPAEPAAPANVANYGNVRSFAELAPEIRAQLPQVSISGSTYSSNPAHRMLIANGKVVHEGEEIAPGLQLETIGPGKAVLNHRGTRYSIGY